MERAAMERAAMERAAMERVAMGRDVMERDAMGRDESSDVAWAVLQAFAYYEGLVRHSLLGTDNGLSKTQVMMLFVLTVHGPTSVAKLADCLAISREQASRAASALEEQGYLEKERGAANWRMVQLVPTDKARVLVDGIVRQASRSIDESLKVLSADEKDALFASSMQAASILREVAVRLQ